MKLVVRNPRQPESLEDRASQLLSYTLAKSGPSPAKGNSSLLPRKLLELTVLLVALLAISTSAYAAPPQNIPPTIETPTIQPTNPSSADPVIVSVIVTAAVGVSSVSIVYTTDNWTSVNIVLPATYNSTSGLAQATIPALQGGGRVSYYVVAYDTSGNRGVNDNAGRYFTYQVATGPSGPGTSITSSWGLLVIAAIAAMVMGMVLFFARRRKNTTASQSSTHK